MFIHMVNLVHIKLLKIAKKAKNFSALQLFAKKRGKTFFRLVWRRPWKKARPRVAEIFKNCGRVFQI